jgi:hypothetical protein
MAEPMVSVDNKTGEIEGILSILVASEYLTSCIPSGSNMIEGTGIFYPERACHEKGKAALYAGFIPAVF